MAEIRHTRFQQLLRQVFAITERYSPTAIEDLMPVYSVEDPAEPHLQLAKESFIVFGGASIIPAAADIAQSDLTPTAVHDAALDVLLLTLNNTGAGAMNILISHVGGNTLAPTQLTPLDGRRIGSEIQPQRAQYGFTAQQAGGAIAPFAFGVTLAGGTGMVIPWRATLFRSTLRFQGTLVNNPMRIGVIGQERVIEPAEKRSKITNAP
jgi:hypothetical protein